VVIPSAILDEMVAHAREGSPEEVCGILAGTDGNVTRLYRITNAEHSPRLYLMDSQEQLQAMLDIDDRDLDLTAVYHSHPASPPRPSKTDIELAQWPGTAYVIVSLTNPEAPEIRGWQIESGGVSEIELTVSDDEPEASQG